MIFAPVLHYLPNQKTLNSTLKFCVNMKRIRMIIFGTQSLPVTASKLKAIVLKTVNACSNGYRFLKYVFQVMTVFYEKGL